MLPTYECCCFSHHHEASGVRRTALPIYSDFLYICLTHCCELRYDITSTATCLRMLVSAYYTQAHCRTGFRLALRLCCAAQSRFREVAFFGKQCSQIGKARECENGGHMRVHLLAARSRRVAKAKAPRRGLTSCTFYSRKMQLI